MRTAVLFSLAVLTAGSLTAQSNTVVGLDGRLEILDNITYWGRRGAAFPGGEVGLSMRNTMCNPGSVNIPWFAAMQADHPKFGFMIVRESGGRMEQISDYSYCKHAFTSASTNGGCGACNGIGGTMMGLRCSDTYGAGNNADRFWLGPPSEIDPWLGTWNPVGSYFDRGDPDVGFPQNQDGARSAQGGFDSVQNRVTVKESDLTTAGANYFYAIHLIHQGEALANRGDNLASRGFVPTFNGSGWSVNNNSVGQVWGSVLQHWNGATIDSASNGADDGRFFVAVNVTPNGGLFHYEYAIHNVDNNRGAGVYRIPVDAGATVSGFGFRDIDGNALNNWTGARVGNEIVFTAPANNPQNWNTIYNVWFDCSVAPSNGLLHIDEARVGPGGLSVSVPARVPSGVPTAFNATVGAGCNGAAGPCQASVYELSSPAAFDLANNAMGLSFSGSNYTLGAATGAFVAPTGTNLGLGDDATATVNLPFTLSFPGGSTTSLVVCSNGFVSPVNNGAGFTPSTSGFLSGQACWAAAWHDLNPAAGGQMLADVSPTAVRISWVGVPSFAGGGTGSHTFQYEFLPSNQVNIYWQTMTTSGNNYLVGWTAGNDSNDPGGADISAEITAGNLSLCAGSANVPLVSLDASARPVLGTSITLTTTGIPGGSVFAGLLYSVTQALPPIDLTPIGAPGCFAHVVAPTTWNLHIGPAASVGDTIALPNTAAFIGVSVIWQSATLSPGTTPSGFLTSNGLITFLAAQ